MRVSDVDLSCTNSQTNGLPRIEYFIFNLPAKVFGNFDKVIKLKEIEHMII